MLLGNNLSYRRRTKVIFENINMFQIITNQNEAYDKWFYFSFFLF